MPQPRLLNMEPQGLNVAGWNLQGIGGVAGVYDPLPRAQVNPVGRGLLLSHGSCGHPQRKHNHSQPGK